MSDTKRYPSKYAPDTSVTAAQYITELICEKKAKKDKKDLPLRFWNLPTWGSFFRQQILAANGLLKIYDSAAIVAALNSKKAWGIFSLRAPHLDAIIEEEAAKISVRGEASNLDVAEENAAPRPTVAPTRQDIIQKLRGL